VNAAMYYTKRKTTGILVRTVYYYYCNLYVIYYYYIAIVRPFYNERCTGLAVKLGALCLQGDSPITKHSYPFFSSIIQLFKIWFLELLNIHTDRIFKLLRFFVLLKKCPVETRFFVFQIITALFNYRLFSG